MAIDIDLETAHFDGALGLPYPVRNALFNQKLDEVAFTLDLLLCCGIKPGTEFQLPELITFIRKIDIQSPESILRRGLRNKLFNPVPLPFNGKGYRQFQYRMPDISPLIKKYGDGPVKEPRFQWVDRSI